MHSILKELDLQLGEGFAAEELPRYDRWLAVDGLVFSRVRRVGGKPMLELDIRDPVSGGSLCARAEVLPGPVGPDMLRELVFSLLSNRSGHSPSDTRPSQGAGSTEALRKRLEGLATSDYIELGLFLNQLRHGQPVHCRLAQIYCTLGEVDHGTLEFRRAVEEVLANHQGCTADDLFNRWAWVAHFRLRPIDPTIRADARSRLRKRLLNRYPDSQGSACVRYEEAVVHFGRKQWEAAYEALIAAEPALVPDGYDPTQNARRLVALSKTNPVAARALQQIEGSRHYIPRLMASSAYYMIAQCLHEMGRSSECGPYLDRALKWLPPVKPGYRLALIPDSATGKAETIVEPIAVLVQRLQHELDAENGDALAGAEDGGMEGLIARFRKESKMPMIDLNEQQLIRLYAEVWTAFHPRVVSLVERLERSEPGGADPQLACRFLSEFLNHFRRRNEWHEPSRELATRGAGALARLYQLDATHGMRQLDAQVMERRVREVATLYRAVKMYREELDAYLNILPHQCTPEILMDVLQCSQLDLPTYEAAVVPRIADCVSGTRTSSRDLCLRLAVFLEDRGAYDKALPWYRRVLADHPEPGRLRGFGFLRGLAATLAMEGHVAEVDTHLKVATPEVRTAVWFQAARACHKRDRHEIAVHCYERVRELTRKGDIWNSATFLEAWCSISLGKLDAAAERLSELAAASTAPDMSIVLYHAPGKKRGTRVTLRRVNHTLEKLRTGKAPHEDRFVRFLDTI